MKQLILSILTLLSAHSFAQKEVSCTFDFTQPQKLNPSVTLGKDAGDDVEITGLQFTSDDGNITLSFERGSQPMGARIIVDTKENNFTPYMGLFRTALMKVTSNGLPIHRLEFSNTSSWGDLAFKTDAGQWTYGGYWYSLEGEDDVTELLFENTGVSSKIHQITITYVVPLDNVMPIEVSPLEDEEIPQFDSFVLSFDKEVTVADDAVFTLTGQDLTEPVTLTGKAEGTRVTLTPASPITRGGVYTITCAEKSIMNGEFYNPELTYNVNVVEPKNTFAYTTISIEPGQIDVLPTGIKMTFNTVVGKVSSTPIYIYKEGEEDPVRSVSLEADEKDVTLNFSPSKDIEEVGIYTLTIPEGTIFNIYEDGDIKQRFNPEFTLEYIVGDVKIPASTETIATAKALEESSRGIGYPATESASRKALTALFSSEEATDEDYEAAMKAFIEETDVELPASEQYYSIAAITSTGMKAYLKYADGAVTLTHEATEAASFKATANADGSTTFETADGKYLHILINSDGYEGTSKKNVTETYNEKVNNILLSRLNVEGVGLEQTFGLFSIKGSMGLLGSAEREAYMLIGVEDLSIQTNSDFGLMFFKESMTNAFAIEEQATPEIPIPDAAYTLKPADKEEVESLSTITITFTDLKNVSVTPSAKGFLTDADGRVIDATDITAVEGDSNEFVLNFPDVESGTYTLTIEKGSFSYLYGEQEAVVQAIIATYTVKAIDFKYDFSNVYIFWNLEAQDRDTDAPVRDVALNDFTYCTYDTEFGIADKDVLLVNYYDPSKIITKAHFVKVTDAPSGEYRIRLELDEPITAGSLQKGRYTYMIEKGTFGDANFAKYLKGDPKITKDMCHVNETLTYSFDVDNQIVTSIELLAGKEPVETVIYDLAGRRITGKPHSGIYVINGRKVIIK